MLWQFSSIKWVECRMSTSGVLHIKIVCDGAWPLARAQYMLVIMIIFTTVGRYTDFFSFYIPLL